MRVIDTGTEELLCEERDGVATVRFNRPEKRNALSDELTPALREILLVLEADRTVRCVVITGVGSAFCAGGDVSGMGSSSEGFEKPSEQDAIRRLQHRQVTLTLRLHRLAKPTIASLPGPAAGAGMSIALACDLRIASENAFLASAFANIGLSGDYGGSWFLTQMIGPARAKEIYFTARRVPADEAFQLGVFNEVVAEGDLERRTQELASSIASGPPIAIRYMKENLNRAAVADLETCLDMEADRMVRCSRTHDHSEAVQAFLAKRRPNFEGR